MTEQSTRSWTTLVSALLLLAVTYASQRSSVFSVLQPNIDEISLAVVMLVGTFLVGRTKRNGKKPTLSKETGRIYIRESLIHSVRFWVMIVTSITVLVIAFVFPELGSQILSLPFLSSIFIWTRTQRHSNQAKA